MPKKISPSTINQTAIGDDNIQVVGSNNVITQIKNFFAGDTEQQRAQRNRRAMLELVKNTWIKGVLEKSLYNEVLIELGLEERPSAVDHPWDVQVRMPNRDNRTLPPGTSIMQVFNEMNGSMLILGEPGSGKTTMLLELARDCIYRAQQDENQPIPVVFNLSSWDPKQHFDDWLINELRTKYYVSLQLAQSWVANGDLLLLLDGLDEAKPENRDACVKAINFFRQKHGLTVLMVVCSRITDYEALTTKLDLPGAVVLQALTLEQIDEYFEQGGSELEDVHQILKNDDILQELVKQPLILSIMTLAFQGKSVEVFANQASGTLETGRKHLFDLYIQEMFERVARTKNELYERKQVKRWLAWLAYKIIEHNQLQFLFETMQPSWLGNKIYLLLYRATMGVVIGLILGPCSAIVIGVAGTIISGIDFDLLDVFRWSWPDAKQWMPLWRQIGLVFGLVFALTAALLFGLWEGKKEIKTMDTLHWSWQAAKKALIRGMIGGLLLALLFGLLLSLLIGLVKNDIGGYLVGGLYIGLYLSLITVPTMGLISGAMYGLRGVELDVTTKPGEKISKSVKSAWLAFLLVGLSVTLIFGSFLSALVFLIFGFKLNGIVVFMVIVGISLGLLVGLVWALGNGGLAVIQNYILRLIIRMQDLLPWRLIPFLDYCVDRIFLRRVGGGYIFVHRLLQEHFAAMYPADEK